MEASSACLSRLNSSAILFSPFSDQSYVDFYHHRSPSLASPSLTLKLFPSWSLPSPSSWKPSVTPLRALCEGACASSPVLEPSSEQTSLMMELAELKLQMKQKKKELKAQKKDEKKRMKIQMKEGKKAIKPKDGTEGKRKKNCQSEALSSSESSDSECESMSMGMLRQGQSSPFDFEGASARIHGDRNAADVCDASCGKCSTVGAIGSFVENMSIVHDCVAEKGLSFNGKVGSICSESSVQLDIPSKRPGVSSARCCSPLSSASVQAPNRIEVCAGGKCKKAGSEQLLSTISAQIPSSSNVVAVPCKCMGKCSMALNVKVHKEDTNPQHHSHVRVEDANLILSHHFGLGRPPTGLPSLPSQDRLRVPLPRSVSSF